jgi:hypothetical protein
MTDRRYNGDTMNDDNAALCGEYPRNRKRKEFSTAENRWPMADDCTATIPTTVRAQYIVPVQSSGGSFRGTMLLSRRTGAPGSTKSDNQT